MKELLYKGLIVLLGGIFIYQGVNLALAINKDISIIWKEIGMPATWRSARFSHGIEFANFIDFIKHETPNDAVVILPPDGEGHRNLSTSAFMQFFLIPRKVINCRDYDCYQNDLKENAYKLITTEGQKSRLNRQRGEILMFNQKWGLALPESKNIFIPETERGFNSIRDILKAGVQPLIWLVMTTIAGALVINKWLPVWDWPAKVALGYGLAQGIISVSTSAYSLVGGVLTSKLIWSISILLVIFSIFLNLSVSDFQSKQNFLKVMLHQKLKIDIGLSLILFIGCLAVIISVGKSYHTTDAIQAWGVKGYAISLEGSIKNTAQWGTNPWAYPLHIPVMIAVFKTLFGENLPASKMLFSGYYLFLVVFIYYFARRITGDYLFSGLITLLIATTPFMFTHGTIAYANIPYSYYLIIAVLLISQIFNTDNVGFVRWAVFCGLFFALASWTRPEGVSMSFLGIGVISVASGSRLNRDWVKKILWIVFPVFIYLFFWFYVKKYVYFQPVKNDGMLYTSILKVFSDGLLLEEAIYLLRSGLSYVISTDKWGLSGILLLILLPVMGVLFRSGRQSFMGMILCGLAYEVIIFFSYYLTSYNSQFDISRWVSTGLDRAMMPGIIILWVGCMIMVRLALTNTSSMNLLEDG